MYLLDGVKCALYVMRYELWSTICTSVSEWIFVFFFYFLLCDYYLLLLYWNPKLVPFSSSSSFFFSTNKTKVIISSKFCSHRFTVEHNCELLLIAIFMYIQYIDLNHDYIYSKIHRNRTKSQMKAPNLFTQIDTMFPFKMCRADLMASTCVCVCIRTFVNTFKSSLLLPT